MSAQHYQRQGTSSFRKPASYGRDAFEGEDASPEAAPAAPAAGDDTNDSAEGTRAFSSDEVEGAREPGARRQGMSSVGQQGTAEPRVDQTLVSPLARERIRAEMDVPDPATPPRRQAPQARQAYPGRGMSRSQYQRQQPQQQPPLQRRRPPAQAQRPPMAPSPEGYAYQPQAPAPEPERTHAVARGILLLVSWLFRIGAWVLVALVIANSFTVGNRVTLMRLTERVTQLLPTELAGLYVLDTPFGGAFRGDFAIAAIVLFVLDWIVARIRRHLR